MSLLLWFELYDNLDGCCGGEAGDDDIVTDSSSPLLCKSSSDDFSEASKSMPSTEPALGIICVVCVVDSLQIVMSPVILVS